MTGNMRIRAKKLQSNNLRPASFPAHCEVPQGRSSSSIIFKLRDQKKLAKLLTDIPQIIQILKIMRSTQVIRILKIMLSMQVIRILKIMHLWTPN